jgi:hypothetical protein
VSLCGGDAVEIASALEAEGSDAEHPTVAARIKERQTRDFMMFSELLFTTLRT